ncbi:MULTISPECIES: hypothetical protein [unclassified Roseovarius]|uniref:hypothetical protein n=1 Tax=unclassified Roseovarius TaxID=2614913 RepID=UPI00273D5C2C|nr:hypothetical protein [Roseovarius sp. MMSF_3350]
MLNKFAKLALTATAIAPVGFTYSISAFIANENKIGTCLIGATIGLVVLCFIIFKRAKEDGELVAFKISSVEAADRENTSLLLVYLLPLFTADFQDLNWLIWLPTILILGIVVGTGYSYHFNPILGLAGWHFYRVTTPESVTFVLLTKKELRAASECLKVKQLTEYIVVDAG